MTYILLFYIHLQSFSYSSNTITAMSAGKYRSLESCENAARNFRDKILTQSPSIKYTREIKITWDCSKE